GKGTGRGGADGAVGRAPGPQERAVQLDERALSRGAVEAVDVLRDDARARKETLDAGQRQVCRVGPGVADEAPPPFVPAPHLHRVLRERLRARQLLRTKPLPDAARTSERRQAALDRDAGA